MKASAKLLPGNEEKMANHVYQVGHLFERWSNGN